PHPDYVLRLSRAHRVRDRAICPGRHQRCRSDDPCFSSGLRGVCGVDRGPGGGSDRRGAGGGRPLPPCIGGRDHPAPGGLAWPGRDPAPSPSDLIHFPPLLGEGQAGGSTSSPEPGRYTPVTSRRTESPLAWKIVLPFALLTLAMGAAGTLAATG